MLSRELHDDAYTAIRQRNGNDEPCTTFIELRAFEVDLGACVRGGIMLLLMYVPRFIIKRTSCAATAVNDPRLLAQAQRMIEEDPD